MNDNASNYRKVEKLIEEKFPHMICSGHVASDSDLISEDLNKLI